MSTQINCPNCGHSHYEYKYSMCTAMYYPPIYKDGVNTNPDGNVTTTYCRCLNCNHEFHYMEQYGEITDIIDDGQVPEVPILHVPITVPDNEGTTITLEEAVLKSNKAVLEEEHTATLDKAVEKIQILEERISCIQKRIEEDSESIHRIAGILSTIVELLPDVLK